MTIEEIVKWLKEEEYDFRIIREEFDDEISSRLVTYTSERMMFKNPNPCYLPETKGIN